MQRIEITRAQFEERFGFKPDPEVLATFFYGRGCSTPFLEYVFIDDAEPSCPEDVRELVRMWNLEEVKNG